VGIALVGIGTALGINSGMIAGAVISGAYFGDKMSPLSDTTNLAPAMAGTDLFTHIRYMSITTVPTIIVTLIVFGILSVTITTSGNADVSNLLETIANTFNITPWLFLVPLGVIGLILLKTKPLVALSTGVLLAAAFAFIFQPDILNSLGGSKLSSVITSIFSDTQITTENEKLNDLFSAGGMKGMLWTIFLIICAMVFGGIMDGIGALARITSALLSIATSVFGLFASTVISCLGLNTIASDQYLAIVIPGKMFKQAYEDRGLAPENLSRTLEDSGTVTSVLIPWNTCGAYQSGVLGVSVADYFIYAIFNWLSPFTTLLFAAFRIKIKQIVSK
jgi:NhaC family Na+:H+ antiporter